MDPLETARQSIPLWVRYGPLWLGPIAAFVMVYLAAWLGAAIAARPLRKSGDAHWTEQARLAYPLRFTFGFLPFVLTAFAAALRLVDPLGPLASVSTWVEEATSSRRPPRRL